MDKERSIGINVCIRHIRVNHSCDALYNISTYRKRSWNPQAVDVLTPIGRGQAQLIIGPRGSGKTALALDAILGQHAMGVQCVYAPVGQSCAPEVSLCGPQEF